MHSPRRPALAAAAALAGALACGGGDGGGPLNGGPGSATISIGELTAGPAERRQLEVSLASERAAAGMQVDVVVDPAVLPEAEGVAALGRAAGLEATFHNLARGRVRLLLFEPQARASLEPGAGPVLSLSFRVGDDAPAGPIPVELEGGRVVDDEGDAFEITLVPGRITIVR